MPISPPLPIAIMAMVVACVSDQDTASVDLETRAGQFVEWLDGGRYEQAVECFDTTMTRVMPPNKLKEVWQSLPAKFGAFQEIAGVTLVAKGELQIAVVTCRFEKAQLDVKVVYDDAGRVSGLWFAPTPPPESPPPPYANPERYTEKEITVGSGWWKLPGTLTVPAGAGPFPAVVLVHGSGPNDRDETLGPNKPFRDLAWGLATRGVAVLRYEKRSRYHKFKMLLLANRLTVREETVDDALAAVAAVRVAENIDPRRVCVLGHSLGGMLIPRIAEGDSDLAGLIVLAGTSRPFEDVLLEQFGYVLSTDGDTSAEDVETLEKIKVQVARVKSPELSTDTPATELPLGVPASYWLDLRGYEPARQAAKLETPLLVVQAGRDYQVTMKDFELWQQHLSGKHNVTFRVYPKCNHLLIEGEGQCTPDEYAIAGHVAESVVSDIAAWIKQNVEEPPSGM